MKRKPLDRNICSGQIGIAKRDGRATLREDRDTASRCATKSPHEPAALAAIAEVNAAQKIYMARNRRYALTYEELREALFLKEEPTVEKTGYEIKLRPATDAGSYAVLAVPSTPSSAARHFFSDQTGVIRAEQGKDANAQSPAISQ